jgi:P4 family phage/plasmid primase-like protien
VSKAIIPSPTKGNKNGAAGKAPASKVPGKKAASTQPGCVTIRVGSKTATLPLTEIDQVAVRDVVDQLGHGTAPVELGVDDFAAAAPQDRGRFWTLYRSVRGSGPRPVAVRTGGKTFAQPADWAASGLLAPTDDADARCRALELAAEVLAHACPAADRDIHLDAVAVKLRDRGFGTAHCDEVKRNIRQRLREYGRAATEKVGGGTGACDLAKVFLADRYPPDGGPTAPPEAGNTVPAGPPQYRLRYYGERFYRRRDGVWAEASVEDVKLELTSHLQGVAPDRTGVKHVADALMNAKALCAVRADDTPPLPFYLGDPDRRMLALRNGLLDLTALARGKKAKLRPHDPDWFATTRLPYEFDATADCPRFKAFLAQALDADPKTLKPLAAGDNRVSVVQEWFGYSLLADNRYQKFLMLIGRGQNGKGTILDVWGEMLHTDNVSSVSLEAMAREFGTEPLVGKLLNLAGDMNEVDPAAEGTLKSWTGEDRVTVPRKYRPALEAAPTVKFVYGCNSLPWFKDKSDGIWRRLMVVPFRYAPKTPGANDSKLRPKLRKELPGILNWALAGLARLLEQDGFTPCAVCEAAKVEHREACSPVGEFIGNQFTLASEYAGPKAGLRWLTTTTEVKLLVRDHNAKFGERVVAPHVVCRELAAMKGVFTRRPTTVSGRAEYGTVYCGVCVGEPRPVFPGELDELAEKTGIGGLASTAAGTAVHSAKKSKKATVKKTKAKKTKGEK